MHRTDHGRSGSAALAGLLLAACATGAPVPAPPPAASPSPKPSASALQARCQAGYATACRDLGRAHLLGDGVPLDDRLAAALLIEACEMGESGACSDLSVLSALGRGVAQDDARAAALARRSCSAGFALGCSNLGVLAAEGVGRPAARPGEAGDTARQQQLFRGACEAAVPEGCLNLGAVLQRGGPGVSDRAGAGAAYRRACDAGLALACHRLVHLATDGNTEAPDPEVRAVAARVCKAGIAEDCRLAGEPVVPPGPRTPSPRLVADDRSVALGIPGAGGFHPADLTPARGGPRRSLDEERRPTRTQLAQVPAALRQRLGLDRPPRDARAADRPVELLVALRQQQLGTCVEHADRQGAPLLEVWATFLIESAGRPEETRAAADPPSPEVERCAAELIAGWEFPVPDGAVSGLHLVRHAFDPVPPGPPPQYPAPGGLRPALEEPGCVERAVVLPPEVRASTASVTVKLAVDAQGTPIMIHAISLAPEPVVAAVLAAVRRCAWRPGLDEHGRKGVFWLTLPVGIEAR